MRLENKTAIVTGGAQGIGAACAALFAREGARVVVADIVDEAGQKLVADIRANGGEATFLHGDMGDAQAIAEMVEQTIAAYGGVDICVCAAGIAPHTPFLEVSLGEFQKVLDVNLTAPFLIGQRVARQLVARGEPGSIINITSTSMHQSGPGQAAYCSSKAGLGGLTRTMAVALAPYKIRVNAVAPGPTKTTLMVKAMEANPDVLKPIIARTPLGIAEPEEIANAVLFLASDESSFITGETLNVDGGRLVLNYTVAPD